jgi:CRP-like cAMP-binding protein
MLKPVDPVTDLLHLSGLCEGLSDADVAVLRENSQVGAVARGEYLWVHGRQADYFVVIGSGMMRLTQATPSGIPVVVELLGRADCMGLLATMGDCVHPFSALALSDVEFVQLDSATFRNHCLRNARLMQNAARAVVPRLLGGFGFMAFMATSDVERRLALALLSVEQLARRESGCQTAIHITRQTLAALGVTTVESAIRVTRRWCNQGIVLTGHGTIQVLNRERLQSIAGVILANNDSSSSGEFALASPSVSISNFTSD